MNKILFINATAALHGGALTIIQQFIDAYARRPLLDVEVYIFCTAALDNRNCTSVKLIRGTPKNFFQRLAWDYSGMKRWAGKQGIQPDLILSFQNTGVFFGVIPQIIYQHNAIPFAPYNWNPFKKEERHLWFYKKIYPRFIRISLFKQSRFIVQTEWMKKKVSEKFNFPEERIFVARPSFNKKTTAPLMPVLDAGVFNFFYPASAFVFKNHLEIIGALAVWIEKQGAQQIKVYLTCKQEELPDTCRQALERHQLDRYFVFLNSLKFEEVLGYYAKADALLFPSRIETVGLPLLEAATYGMPIIAADEAYAREILENYNNVKFVSLDNSSDWAVAMAEVTENAKRGKGLNPVFEDDWIKVLSLIESILRPADPVRSGPVE